MVSLIQIDSIYGLIKNNNLIYLHSLTKSYRSCQKCIIWTKKKISAIYSYQESRLDSVNWGKIFWKKLVTYLIYQNFKIDVYRILSKTVNKNKNKEIHYTSNMDHFVLVVLVMTNIWSLRPRRYEAGSNPYR